MYLERVKRPLTEWLALNLRALFSGGHYVKRFYNIYHETIKFDKIITK